MEAEKARKTTIKKTEGSNVVPYGLVGLETAKRVGNGSSKSLKKGEVQKETTQKEIQKETTQKEIQKESTQNKPVQKDSMQKEPMNTESKSNARISTNTKSAEKISANIVKSAADIPHAPAAGAQMSAQGASAPSTSASAASSSAQTRNSYVTAHSHPSSGSSSPGLIPVGPRQSSSASSGLSKDQTLSAPAPSASAAPESMRRSADPVGRAARPLQSQRSAFNTRKSDTMQKLKSRMEREKRIN